jgi:hypothetical protein
VVGSITYHHLCWWSHHFSWANPIVNPTFLQILPRILSPFVVFFYRFFPIFCTDFRLPGHQLTNRRPFEASSSPWPWSNGRPSAQKWGTRSVAVSSQGMGWGFMGFNEPTLYRYIYMYIYMIILKRMEYDMDFQDTSKIGARLNIPYGICSRRNIYCIYIHRYYLYTLWMGHWIWQITICNIKFHPLFSDIAWKWVALYRITISTAW